MDKKEEEMNGETTKVNGVCEKNENQPLSSLSQTTQTTQKKKQKRKQQTRRQQQPIEQPETKETQQPTPTPKSSYNRIFPALPGTSSNHQNGHQNGTSNGGPHHHHRSRKPDMEIEKQKMRIGPSNVSKLFYVSHDERKSDNSDRFGEGELQSSCGQISRDTGANIEFCLSKDQSLSFIVTGRDQDVQDALQKIAYRFQTVPSRQITIAKEFHKTIIGLKGIKLKEIEVSTSTKIQIPRIMSQSDLITISGPKDGIEKAAIEIQRIAAEQANRASETLIIEKEFHPFLCGVNNKTITGIMNELGVKINVPPEMVEKDDIIIVGNRENVSIAKSRILNSFESLKSSYILISWDVPKSQHKYIGNRSMYNEVLDKFNVVVNCPLADSTSTSVQLRGPLDNIGSALILVHRQAFSMKKVDMEVENSYHKYLMGEKGANLQNMKEQYPRTNVRLMKVENRVEIEGPNEEVDLIEKQIQSMLKDVSFEKVPIDPKFIMRIIGRSGINLNYLKNQYNVMVNILDEDQNKKFVTIVGKKDDVNSAFEDINAQIKKLENEEDIKVEIEQKHHGGIIGSRGKNVRELRDKYPEVVINFPDASENANYVQVRGPREEVLLVKEFLLEKAKEIEEASFRKEIHIKQDIYDFLAEKGTLKIRKIQADTATKIDYYESTESVVIIGRRENVARAEEVIGSVLEESPNVATAEVHVPPKFIEIFTRLPNWALNTAIDGAAEVVVKLENERNSNVVRIKGDQELVEKVRGQLENIALYSQEFEVNTQYQQTVISSNLKRIQETMNVKTIMANLKDSSKNIAVIVGPKEHLKRAVDKFDAIIKNIDKMIEETILIDMKYHKNFLTRKSELCNRIIEECGGNLTIAFPSSMSQSDSVTIQGFRESVHLAKQKLNDHVNDFMTFVEIECVIPQRHHRNIVGPKGSVVKEICSKFNVNIKLPSKSSNNYAENGCENGNEYDVTPNGGGNNSNDTILIVGKEENCLLAKQSLIDLIPITREVEVPCDLHYSIIGQKGRNIRSLMDKFNVYVDVPSSSMKSNTIKITGSKKNIDEAISEIMQQTFEIKLQVDPKWHSKIIGRKGAIVNKIRGDHNVKIAFPNKDDSQNDTITIIGNEVDATAAKMDILKIIDEFNNMYMEEVHIDSNVHSRLIGSQGAHIKKVMKTYNVEITFPRGDEANSDVVMVYGKEQNVQEAVKYLEDKAEDFLQEFESEMYDKNAAAANTTTYTENMFVNSSKKGNGYVNGNGRNHGNVNGNGAITWEHPTVTANCTSMPNTASNKDFPSFNANDVQTQSNDGLTITGQPTQPIATGNTTNNSLPVINAWGLPSKRR